MAFFKLCLVFIAFLTRVSAEVSIAPSLVGGTPADTLRRFPYHVTIKPIRESAYSTYNVCGGSIISDQWILTSAFCLAESTRIEIHFERLYINDIVGSYAAVVNKDAVHFYPTYTDDLALIKLPFQLIYSVNVKEVRISTTPVSESVGKFAVLPGFNNTNEHTAIGQGSSTSQAQSAQLSYVMLKIISNTKCAELVTGDFFDEYLQMCTEGWDHMSNAPCFTDWGSGLVVGWPSNPQLVGIFSKFYGNCNGPHVYTNIAKYTAWIENLIFVCD